MGWRELGAAATALTNAQPRWKRHRGLQLQGYAAAPMLDPPAFMTGQYPARIGITNYLEVNDSTADYISINERLKSVGYVSALIGKWHLTGDYEKRRGLRNYAALISCV